MITADISNGTLFKNNQSVLPSSGEDEDKVLCAIDANQAMKPSLCDDSQLIRAKWLVQNNKIIHVAQSKAFNVINENDEPYLVRLFPKPICTCKSETKCCHIIAVQLSLGIEIKDKKNIPNLTKLRRNIQNGKKTGRKMRAHKK